MLVFRYINRPIITNYSRQKCSYWKGEIAPGEEFIYRNLLTNLIEAVKAGWNLIYLNVDRKGHLRYCFSFFGTEWYSFDILKQPIDVYIRLG